MQELLVSKLSRKCVMGARLIDKQYASRYKLANTCNVQSDDMRAKNVTQFFPSNKCTAHRVCAKEPRLAIKQRLQVMSRGQYRLVTQRGKLFGLDALCTPCQPLIIDQF